ncbi:MAG: tRNA (adenosine(37)-N6)-threonylcarbamoyltransferase complex dimerization subunit type 1 TsaB [Pseudomonadota bacterium]
MGLRSKRPLRVRRPHPFLPSEGLLTAALDASTEAVGVAIARGDTCLLSRRTLHAAPRGTALSAVLTDALAELSATQADLGAVVASRGPGSFTGVRLTLMAAKALAWSLGIPLVTVDTPRIVAASAAGPVAVAMDARQGEVYLALYDAAGDLVGPMEPLAPEDAADRVSEFTAAHPEVTLAGTGFVTYAPLRALRGTPLQPGDFPDPAALLTLGLARLAASDTDDPVTAEPQYVRAFKPTAPPRR